MNEENDNKSLLQKRENLEHYILIVLLIFISTGGFFSIFFSERNLIKRNDQAILFVVTTAILWILVTGVKIFMNNSKVHKTLYLVVPVIVIFVFILLLPGSNLVFLIAAMSFLILIGFFSFDIRNIIAVLITYFGIFLWYSLGEKHVIFELHTGFYFFGMFLAICIGIVTVLGIKIFDIYKDELRFKINRIKVLYNKSEKNIEKLDHVFDASLDGIIEYDYGNDAYTLSRNAQKILGRDIIDTKALIDNLHKGDDIRFRDIWLGMREMDTLNCEVEVKYNRQGEIIVLRIILLKYISNVDKMSYVVIVIKDITNEKYQTKKIHDLAYRDSLTGINNKIALCKKVDAFIKKDSNNCQELAIIYFDISKFRYINSTFGYEFGNQLIASLGIGLKVYEDESISIARVSGDDFAIAVENFRNLEKIVSNLVTDFTTYYSGETEFKVNFNIGIAIFQEGENSAEELLKNAELAMYEAKLKGPNRPIYFKQVFNEEYQDQLLLSVALENAIKAGEIYVNYQPVITSETNEIIAFEALARWKSQRYGIVSPDVFIKLAESTGYINTFGNYILEQACHFVNRINGGEKKYRVSINISAVQLYDIDFYDIFMGILERTVTAKEYIGIEITETAFIKNMEIVNQVIKRIREAGIKVYLDDFGTGFSSLNYLRTLPIDTLKIDKSFIDDVTADQKGSRLVEHIISLAHALDLTVVAEGVETQEQKDRLKKLGCNNIQGYYYSKPLTVQEAIAYIEQATLL